MSISSLLVQAISVLSSIRIVRLLNPSGYGLYSVVFVYISVFGIIAAFGMRQPIIRYVAREPFSSKNIFNLILFIRLITLCFSSLILVLYIILFDNNSKSFLLLSLLLLVANNLYDSIEIIITGLEKLTLPAQLNFIFTCVWVIIIYIIPGKFINVFSLIEISVGLQILKTVTFYFVVEKNKYFIFNPNFIEKINFYRQLIKESIPYFLIALLTLGTNQIPVVFLYKNSGVNEVGYYNLAFKILGPLQLILANALNALFPRAAKIAVINKSKFHQTVMLSYKFLLLLSFLLALPITLFKNEIVLLLYGRQFLPSANVISIQVWFFVVFSFVWLTGIYYGAVDKQNLLSIVTIIRTLIQVPILYWSSNYGAFYFSLSYVLLAILDFFIHWIIFVKSTKISFNNNFLIIFVLLLFLGISFTIMLPNELNIFIKVITTLLIFVVSYYIFKKYLNIELKII